MTLGREPPARRAARLALGLALLAPQACGRARTDAHVAEVASSRPSANAIAAFSAAPSASAPVAPAFAGRFGDHSIRLAHGLARALPSGELAVVLTSEPRDCSASLDDADAVELRVSPGPGARFFAGSAIGVEVRVALAKSGLFDVVPPRLATLTLAPVVARAGEHVRGALAIDALFRDDVTGATRAVRAEGPFDVAICPGDAFDRLVAERTDAPETALAGRFDKNEFKARSAVAIARHDALNGVDYVSEIVFYDRAEMTCEWHAETRRMLEYLTLEAISGAASRAPAPGVPQPARAYYWTPSKTDVYSKERHPLGESSTAARAWVKLDAISFEDKAPISGVVVVASPPGSKPEQTGRFEGAFTGIVCRR
jgi:hypothetical protein